MESSSNGNKTQIYEETQTIMLIYDKKGNEVFQYI